MFYVFIFYVYSLVRDMADVIRKITNHIFFQVFHKTNDNSHKFSDLIIIIKFVSFIFYVYSLVRDMADVTRKITNHIIFF